MSEPTFSNIPEQSPFAADQRALLDQLLPGLQPEQVIWLSGYLAALGRGASLSGATTVAAPAPATRLTVLYGTESGNAESLAEQTAKRASSRGFNARTVNMADTSPGKIAEDDNILVIVSTWGEGDPPETATEFYAALMADDAPSFAHTRFAVCGLGDTSYEEFCKMGKDFDRRIESLGGERIAARADCDVDFDETYEAWAAAAIEALEKHAAPAAPATTAAAVATAAVYDRKNPFPSVLKERILLNDEGSAKETYHLEFDLTGSGMHYEPGDALAVLPANAAADVDAILAATGLHGSTSVSLKTGEVSLRSALSEHLDITSLSKPVIKNYAALVKDSKLEALLEDANKQRLSAYMDGRQVIDLLVDFSCKGISADELVGILRKLPPRLYSIASSQREVPNEVHLTVGALRYSAHGKQRQGVCSTFLAERIEVDERCRVYVNQNKNFRLPEDPDTPIIMVGPGTGIAPFRAFLQERKAIGARGGNWLFFGDQHFTTDFLYQTEIQDYLADGLLKRLDLAFSRDQKNKIYVQDRMRQKSKELFAWLQEGARFYVCGDALKMAQDVDAALHAIVAREGGMQPAEAAEYVTQLKAEKRYQRDVY